MIDIRNMNDFQLRAKAYNILSKELGAAGLIRFLQQFDQGEGNHTAEREDLLKNETIDSIVSRIGL